MRRASLEAMDLTLKESLIALFLAILPSPLKVRLYRLAGAHIGRGVTITFGSVVMADRFSEIQIGDFTTIRYFTFIICRKVYIGKYVHIPMHVWIWGSGTLTIKDKCTFGTHNKIDLRRNNIYCGEFVGIAGGCTVYTHSHFFPYTQGWVHYLDDIILEDYVFISMNSTLLPGVRIGKNTVVAAGSVVNKSLPPNSFAGGVPAKVISHIDKLKDKVDTKELKRRTIKIARDLPDFYGYPVLSERYVNGNFILTFKRSTITSARTWKLVVAEATALDSKHMRRVFGDGNIILFSTTEVPREIARNVKIWFDIKNMKCGNPPNRFAIDIWFFLRNTWMVICDMERS